MRAKIIPEAILRELYVDKGLSLRKIAKELDRPITSIKKYMDKYGIECRSKSQAQSAFLSKNDHPMKGKKHSDETKSRISNTLGSFWDNLSTEEREKYTEIVGSGWKKKWASMNKEERENLLSSLNAASRANQGNGSRFERFLAEQLRNRGYSVEERTHNYMPSARFEVDIALAAERVMIEVDGPTHFLPIYGEEALEKQQAKDSKKDEYLTSADFDVLRVRDNNGPLSQARIERIVTKITEILENKKRQVYYIL